jgi:lysozyme
MTLAEQITRDEGLRLFPYEDETGNYTIGVGRNLTRDGISSPEAITMRDNDIVAATLALSQSYPWTDALDEIRRDAMINMTYNMGIAGLSEFKEFLAAMQVGNWTEAKAQMLNSEWAEQVGARAQRLAIQVENGGELV